MARYILFSLSVHALVICSALYSSRPAPVVLPEMVITATVLE